jgi:hypothetical protein
MPRGNWVNIAKVAGLATLAVLAIFGLRQLQVHSDELEQYAAYRSDIHRQNAEYHIERVCPTAPSKIDCINQTRQAKRENQREEQDLAAQKITAWWTQVMGIAAMIGMALSAVGVYLVWTTFAETRRGNAIARNVQRPWMKASAEIVKFQPFSDRFEFSIAVKITNIGSMIAEDTRLNCLVMAVPMRYFSTLDSVFAQWEVEGSTLEPIHVLPNEARDPVLTGHIEYPDHMTFDTGRGKRLRVAILAYCTYRIPGEMGIQHTKQSWLIELNRDGEHFRAGLPIEDMANETVDDVMIVGAGRYSVS